MAAGVSAVEFWQLTPYLTKQVIKAVHDERITQTWMLANMTRAKKLPPLEKLLSRGRQNKGDVGMRLKAALMAINVKRTGHA